VRRCGVQWRGGGGRRGGAESAWSNSSRTSVPCPLITCARPPPPTPPVGVPSCRTPHRAPCRRAPAARRGGGGPARRGASALARRGASARTSGWLYGGMRIAPGCSSRRRCANRCSHHPVRQRAPRPRARLAPEVPEAVSRCGARGRRTILSSTTGGQCTTVAPYSFTASTFTFGALLGMTMNACSPATFAASAIACGSCD